MWMNPQKKRRERMNEYTDYSDETLVTLTLLGSDHAFETLVVRHERAVLGAALRVTAACSAFRKGS